MKTILLTLKRVFLASSAGITAFIVLYAFSPLTFLPALLGGGATYVMTNYALRQRSTARALLPGPVGDDRYFAEQTLKEARKKLRALGRLRFKIRSLTVWLKVSRLYKLANQIITIAEKEPQRIKKIPTFFNHYLDATVTIMEKYVLLAAQPIENSEIRTAMTKTESSLDELHRALETELHHLLSNDILDLNVEIDVLKSTFNHKGEGEKK
ncbi:5-bromo-4-chloroindolyl phosphate hydrolysis family protein [Heliophilum fasciatum]|uniref:5-bromo-4-chloroindolyl phosphate hydrolysis protein n=1 Tax=Heliophilum fasciatum TaxID=35700 RepID=A0A4R2S8A2_9FIRM|nr:5-bromo-4-chloroindolyl phosphate hydrolysis family protein [Heliophilum fasciatum]MCW2276899.1 5-bromo-4-chloroindolyl phosphate hydrolysis protein [Heliophilum fasciatum]TCP68641.1 5-bromo-4-chloroindolyl phosphate hydrolysis protein [Heliophilum fasciatum]